MKYKVKIWSELTAEGKREWRHQCIDCAEEKPVRNWFTFGGPWSRWEWAMEDAESHLMVYH